MQRTKFEYTTLNEEAWNRNLNKIFFLYFLGIIFAIVMMYYHDFDVTPLGVLIRITIGWANVLLLFSLIEATCATITKIALDPGCLINSYLMVLKVFPKTIVEFYKRFFNSFEKVTIIHKSNINTNYNNFIQGYGVTDAHFTKTEFENYSMINIPGYIKEPANFK